MCGVADEEDGGFVVGGERVVAEVEDGPLESMVSWPERRLVSRESSGGLTMSRFG